MSFSARLAKAVKSSTLSFSGQASGTTVGATAISIVSNDMEPDSLVANVQTNITTSSLTMLSKWQVSQDNSTWVDLKGLNSPAEVAVAEAGTGSAVSTNYAHACPINPSHAYVRLAVKSGGASGVTADTAVVSYNWRKRSF